MMSYDSKDGIFPLTKKECECISALCYERCSEMDEDLENKDPHKYILIKSIASKMEGYTKLMNARKATEEQKRKDDIETTIHLRQLNNQKN